MAILKQSTAFTRMFLMVDSSDHITGKTGLTVTLTLSKAGGSFGAAGGTVTEVSSGWYKVALNTTDTNTLGDLAYHATSTGADPTDFVDQVSVRLIDDAAFPATSGRSMVVDASGLVDANTVKVGPTGSGAAQTARDIGSSVLLSAGSGTGQLDFTSGVVKANLAQILGTALTETAGLLAGGFKKLFNVASPTLTCLGVDQTGDNYARIGAPVGASISADVAGVQTDTTNIKTRIPTALTANGNMKSSMLEIITTALTETSGLLAGGFKKFFNIASPAATMDHGVLVDTVTTTTTATNLTNAATAGDLTATMKTSVTTAATAATPTAAGVTADVGITQAAADKVFGSSGAALAELAADPTATPTPRNALMLIFMTLRNKLTTTATSKSIFNSAGSSILSKALSDDGTTYTEAKMS